MSLGQHKDGRSHAEKVKSQLNYLEKTGETPRETSQLSPKSASNFQLPKDKGSLEKFAWVKCKRLGCGFTEVGLEGAAMRHQAKAHI